MIFGTLLEMIIEIIFLLEKYKKIFIEPFENAELSLALNVI